MVECIFVCSFFLTCLLACMSVLAWCGWIAIASANEQEYKLVDEQKGFHWPHHSFFEHYDYLCLSLQPTVCHFHFQDATAKLRQFVCSFQTVAGVCMCVRVAFTFPHTAKHGALDNSISSSSISSSSSSYHWRAVDGPRHLIAFLTEMCIEQKKIFIVLDPVLLPSRVIYFRPHYIYLQFHITH